MSDEAALLDDAESTVQPERLQSRYTCGYASRRRPGRSRMVGARGCLRCFAAERESTSLHHSVL